MNTVTVFGATTTGINGVVVKVDALMKQQPPETRHSGVRDDALSETLARVRLAMSASGQPCLDQAVSVDLWRDPRLNYDSATDLAIALAILAAAGRVPIQATQGRLFLGELGSDGSICPVRGIVPMAIAAAALGIRHIVAAQANVCEAVLVPGVSVHAVTHLRQIISDLQADTLPPPTQSTADDACGVMCDWGTAPLPEAQVCDALAVAAAGGHHMVISGMSGFRISRAAGFFAALLPDLTDGAALEVAALHSVAGRPRSPGVFHRPPQQTLRSTDSFSAIVGGGNGNIRPGTVSLAHHGLLFLDEAFELPRSAIHAMSQVLDHRAVTITRPQGIITFPAAFQMLLARPPHPGFRFRPDLDSLSERADVTLELSHRPKRKALKGKAHQQAFALLRTRVKYARMAASQRWARFGWQTNVQATLPVLQQRLWRLPRSVTWQLQRFADMGALSPRGQLQTLRLAWTLADLAGRQRPASDDVSAAIALRVGAFH